MKFLINPCTDPHWNMAFDEFALEGLDIDESVFYLWQNAPAVIIGLNQSAYAEVNLPFLEERGIVLARRVTGGGAVYHDLGNLNYSIVGPLRSLENAYGLVAEALQKLGVPAERSGRNDILVQGRKCSGYAKRMSKNRMMIHGTLMWDVNLEDLTQALAVPGSKLEAAGVASVRSRVANLKDWLPQFPHVLAFRDALRRGNRPGAFAAGRRERHGRCQVPHLGLELRPLACNHLPKHAEVPLRHRHRALHPYARGFLAAVLQRGLPGRPAGFGTGRQTNGPKGGRPAGRRRTGLFRQYRPGRSLASFSIKFCIFA